MGERDKDPVPDTVGRGRKKFTLIKDRHLGSGHFGDVYMGQQVRTDLKVAVKLDHTSGSVAHREWEMLRALAGTGVPNVHWTGAHGNYNVIVMDLLGISLQNFMDRKAQKSLSWEETCQVGRQCLELLRKMHERGYVHGDVKPENFLFEYHESPSQTVASDRIYVVDLGLASKWSAHGGHMAYKQRVGRFSGTVRYAATHTHFGRWLARRDDVESLGYVLLYLLLGRLPWQGFKGDDKDMRVGEMKGRLSVAEICGDAPKCMHYFLSYCRSLRFDDEPDYAYLNACLNAEPTTALKNIRKYVRAQDPAEADRVPVPVDDAVRRVGDKRKRSLDDEGGDGADDEDEDDEDEDDEDEDGDEDGDEDDADIKIITKPAAAAAAAGGTAKRALKKPKIAVPDVTKVYQWIIVTTAITGQSQNFSTQNSYSNMVTEIKRQWDKGRRITNVSLPGSHYISVCNGHCGLDMQKLKFISGRNWPQPWVDKQLSAGYSVTCVDGNDKGWVIVCSTFEDAEASLYDQVFKCSPTFPGKWVSDRWDDGYYITALATQGDRKNRQWLIVMSLGSPYNKQCVEFGFNYPSEFIHRRWDQGLRITHVACCGELSAYVMSSTYDDIFDPPEQRTVRTNTEPLTKIREDWNKGLYVTGIDWGRVV